MRRVAEPLLPMMLKEQQVWTNADFLKISVAAG